MAYEVHTDVFAGPFDLLLRLITEQRVDLYEVALADIVDAFLAEVEAMQRLDLEVATEFLVIAATLVELKCRRLLPGRDEPDEEHLALLEERDYLLARLVECTTFSAAGVTAGGRRAGRVEVVAAPRRAGRAVRGPAAGPARVSDAGGRPGGGAAGARAPAGAPTSRSTTSSSTRSPSPRSSKRSASRCRGARRPASGT